jgi:hypothetical protein
MMSLCTGLWENVDRGYDALNAVIYRMLSDPFCQTQLCDAYSSWRTT